MNRHPLRSASHLKALALPVLAHRIFLTAGGSAGTLVEDLLGRIPVDL